MCVVIAGIDTDAGRHAAGSSPLMKPTESCIVVVEVDTETLLRGLSVLKDIRQPLSWVLIPLIYRLGGVSLVVGV